MYLNERKIIRLFSAGFGYYNNKEAGSMSSMLAHRCRRRKNYKMYGFVRFYEFKAAAG